MAITCALNDNLLRTTSCGYSLPSIVSLYLINYSDLQSTDTTDDAEGKDEVSGISFASGASVLLVEPAKNSASFEDTLVVEDSGNKYRNASITFNVPGRYSKEMHAALDGLSLGRYTVVVKTADENYLMLGRISPLEAETATLAGGSDTNGMEITLSGNIAESPMTLTAEAVSALLAKVNA